MSTGSPATDGSLVEVRDGGAVAFEEQRPRLFGLAYRMLGSAHDAEDVVQDAYLRWSGADRGGIDSPPAWLTTVVAHPCLNQLTSARARRETYVGPWLPEPVLTPDPALGPADTAELRDSVSMALLVAMERLTPAERAVYVLREAFGYSHRDVTVIVELSEANCRQPHSRARRRIDEQPLRAVRRGQLVRAALNLTGEAADTGGWLLLDLVFADPQHAVTVLWDLGPDAQVIQPQSLRNTLAARAEQTLRQYRCE